MKNTEEKKTKQKNWFKEFFLENRFYMLVLGTVLGIALFLVVKEYALLSKVFFYSNETTENIEKERFITNLLPVILGLPIILFLWIFRTHDTKEQLNKAQTNIEQQDFHDALRMLADDKLVSQEIAVLRLIDISEKNKVYDNTIKLAFIKRMKTPYKEAKEAVEKAKAGTKSQIQIAKSIIEALQQIERRTYAQYIFRWLGKRYARDELDLIKLDLRNQDFTVNKGEEIHYFKDKNNEPCILSQSQLAGVMFYGEGKINLSKIELRLSHLSYINFTRIDLAGANLQSTILAGADLTESNLTGANLREVDLTVADLTGANLTGAKLERANLREVDLTVADLTGANLTGAKLTGAKLTDANLGGVINLTYEQLASVESLYEAKGLETVLKPEELTRLKAEKPELFEPPK